MDPRRYLAVSITPIERAERPSPRVLALAALLGALAGAAHGAHAEGVELVQGLVPAWSGPANNWPFPTGIDATVNWGNRNPLFANKVYFFKDAQYIRYAIQNDAVDPGFQTPQPLDSAH